jgi:FkbM family methyltransferase
MYEAAMPWPQWRNRRDDALLRAAMVALLRPDSNCVDVGANAGSVLADVVRLAPLGRHVAFEPLPELADRLQARFPGVQVRCAALSDRAGEATFHRRLDADSRSGLLPLGGPAERLTVRLEALDEVLGDDYAPDFIKIDVEGAELAALRGARHTIERAGAGLHLFVEMHPQLWPGLGFAAADLQEECRSQGLAAEHLDGSHDNLWTTEGVCLRLRPTRA